MTSVTINGNTYSDDGTAARDMTNGGHRTWLLPMIGDCGTVGAAADVDATAAAASATSAQTYAAALQGTSTTSIAVTTGSKTITTQSGKQFAAGQMVMVVRTSAPTTYLYGSVTSYSSTSLVVNVTDVAGSGTYTDWSIYLSGIKGAAGASGASADRYALTGTATLGSSDKGKRVVVTSGTFSIAFSAAATLTAGWYCWIENLGTGIVTLDPNSSETIDGATTIVMYPQEMRFVYTDGTALYSTVERPFLYSFTAGGTFTKPPGYTMLGGLLWGAGGGGAKRSAGAGGGGGGACVPFLVLASAVGSTETVTIGAGGGGSTVDAAAATAGGDSSLGALVTAYGGAGVPASSAYGGGGGGALSAGSGATAGRPNESAEGSFGGGSGISGTNNSSVYGGGAGGYSNSGAAAGKSVYGGGGGGLAYSGTGYSGGTSVFGGAGGAAGTSASGTAGTAPGGGGGGTLTGTKGGDGARGELRIWGVI